MLDVRIHIRERFDRRMVQIRVNQCRSDEHRCQALNDGRDPQIASYGVLTEHPHLDNVLPVVHCKFSAVDLGHDCHERTGIGYPEIGTSINETGAYAL